MFSVLAFWMLSLTQQDRALVVPVVERPTLQRSYGARTFRGKQEQFEFLMDHMGACSVLSERIGLISYRAEEKGDGRVVGDDKAGAQGFLKQVYCADGVRIYYVEGRQKGIFQAHGRGVAEVRYRQTGPETIEFTGKMYIKIDNDVLATLAQLFFAFVKGTVDRHFDGVMHQPIVLSGFALDEAESVRRFIETLPMEDYRQLAGLRDRL